MGYRIGVVRRIRIPMSMKQPSISIMTSKSRVSSILSEVRESSQVVRFCGTFR